MFKRKLSQKLKEAASRFPVVTLTGPRQSGKTTLLKSLFPKCTYLNLEYPDELAQLKSDPRGLLEYLSRKGMIIDEAQKYPEIFSYIQAMLDEGLLGSPIILSGSQNFLLSKNVGQSLAGRSAILELLPLTYAEYRSDRQYAPCSIWEWLYQGAYPRPYHDGLSTRDWYQSYIKTYLERDVRDLLKVKDLGTFQFFLKLCAARHGKLLNLSQLAVDAGISHTTAREWINLLEASYILYRLQPFHTNLSKRMVKSPKLYFVDSAIVCSLLGIESAEHLLIHAERGAIFEGFVISELRKAFYNQGESPPIYFYRDSNGNEIDALADLGRQKIAIEVKSSATLRPEFLSALEKLSPLLDIPLANCQLVYAGEEKRLLKGIRILPWNELSD
jgi:predicted AAA+ superfamily ATPase